SPFSWPTGPSGAGRTPGWWPGSTGSECADPRKTWSASCVCFLHYKAPGGRTQVSRGAYILLAFFPVFAILLLVRTAAKEDLPMAQWLVLPSPVGELTLAEENGALTGLYFGTRCLLGETGTSPLLE